MNADYIPFFIGAFACSAAALVCWNQSRKMAVVFIVVAAAESLAAFSNGPDWPLPFPAQLPIFFATPLVLLVATVIVGRHRKIPANRKRVGAAFAIAGIIAYTYVALFVYAALDMAT